MLGFLLFIAFVIAYCVVGWQIAGKPYAVSEVDRCIRAYRILADEPGKIEAWRREAVGFAIPLVLIWPVYVPLRIFTHRAAEALPASNEELLIEKQRHEREIQRLQYRIAALERETF